MGKKPSRWKKPRRLIKPSTINQILPPHFLINRKLWLPAYSDGFHRNIVDELLSEVTTSNLDFDVVHLMQVGVRCPVLVVGYRSTPTPSSNFLTSNLLPPDFLLPFKLQINTSTGALQSHGDSTSVDFTNHFILLLLSTEITKRSIHSTASKV